MNVLVINCGSSSVKYELVDTSTPCSLVSGKIQRVGTEVSYPDAIATVLRAVNDHPIDAVGHRVVHGGAHFTDAALITDETVAAIEGCIPLAPLHNPANLAGIQATRAALSTLPQVAVFDTAFHCRLPRRARLYAIDPELAEKYGVQRYGFHGTSHAFVAQQAAAALAQSVNDLRLITCHLGNGASACAVEYGHSVETSMGMTPLEGLVMGTRCGDIDPGALLSLARDANLSWADLDRILNRESGLKGLSGLSNDLRDIQNAAAEGNDRARLAIAVFAHRVRKYIGAYAATMGGVDAIVLTGGIGENSAQMRHRILARFEYLGLVLDEDRNADASVSDSVRSAVISAPHSRVRALVVATDEELMIARETAAVVSGLTAAKEPGPIPIAVSARHVHLTEETFKTLFGPDAQLTVRKPLSQPGQFAANEAVTLIGPRRTIEKVRILGPFRDANQAEISRTDEFHLGVDAPVRASGNTAGSAAITIQGPAGTVQLEEGLICALRHIHMTPADAEAYGVTDRDIVEVAIDGGPRDLIFGDVLVRVKSSYALEMHIDTDEANAAELPPVAEGALTAIDGRVGAIRHRRARHDL